MTLGQRSILTCDVMLAQESNLDSLPKSIILEDNKTIYDTNERTPSGDLVY